MRRRILWMLAAGGLMCQAAYADKSLGFQEERMSPMKTAGYTVAGIGAIVGIVAVADSIESGSDGTKIIIGDPPTDPEEPEEPSEPEVRSAGGGSGGTAYRRAGIDDLGRTTLFMEDISSVFRDLGRRDGRGAEIFVHGMDRGDEYEGLMGGVHFMEDIGRYRDLKFRGGAGYGHAEADYEDGSDGRAEVFHGALYMEYEGETIRSRGWISNEFAYNRFEAGETARYTSNKLAVGSENGYRFWTVGGIEVTPFIFAEAGWYRRGGIDLEEIEAPRDDYISLKWGPGIDLRRRTYLREYTLTAGIRTSYLMEEGDIYDEVETSRGSIEDIAEDRTAEVAADILAEGERFYFFMRGGYYFQSGRNYFKGAAGAGLRL